MAAAPRIAEKLPRLPRKPGVYVFYDAQGRPLYVGKATSLRSRVRSYFGRTSDGRLFRELLLKSAVDVDVLVTANEKEALILENTLIKRHRPRYNIRLRDDKTYLSVAVTVGEEYPRLVPLRRPRRNRKTVVFGPFHSSAALRTTLKLLRWTAGIRTCTNADFATRSRPCIEYEIGHCKAPCVGLQGKADYRKGVEEVLQFLRGRNEPLLNRVRSRMMEAAEAERFEEAARYRDQAAALERTGEAQRVVDPRGGDRDVIGLRRDGERATVVVLLVRDGTLVSTRTFTLDTDLPDRELLAAVIGQLYTGGDPPPEEVLVPMLPDRAPLLAEWLRERRGGPAAIRSPRSGKGRDLLRLATENAAGAATRAGAAAAARAKDLAALGEALGLAAPPGIVECVDVSHLGGSLAVASKVAFVEGEPARSRYKRYRLRGASGADDLAGIREVVTRLLRRGIAEGDLPDLLLVDGGPAQLAAALAAREAAAAPEALPIAAVVKEEGLHTKGETAERVLVPGREAPIELPRGSPVLHLLQRIRDEAHRFAIAYQRTLRRKESLRTGLEGVPGLGPARRRALLRAFGGLDAMAAAGVEALAAVPGMTRKAAEAVAGFLAARAESE
ncbi:MAG: excinuclease ABC subunit UvrC [Planctomycetales bacterium]|nr:excinuclease ABC subunit UvrC [Planctomycetales bacterium]